MTNRPIQKIAILLISILVFKTSCERFTPFYVGPTPVVNNDNTFIYQGDSQVILNGDVQLETEFQITIYKCDSDIYYGQIDWVKINGGEQTDSDTVFECDFSNGFLAKYGANVGNNEANIIHEICKELANQGEEQADVDVLSEGENIGTSHHLTQVEKDSRGLTKGRSDSTFSVDLKSSE